MKLSKNDISNLETTYNYLRVRDELPAKADVIIAGGAGPRIDMADRAAELYKQGVSDLIVFSGFTHPDFDNNEAQTMANRAMALGVPKDHIIIEPNASNTAENLLIPQQILKAKGVVLENTILVHRPFMTRRFKAAAEAQWPKPQPNFFVTCVDLSFLDYLAIDEGLGLANRMIESMLGYYKRVTEYVEKGWQTPQPKDESAEKAFRALKERGFSAKQT